MDHVYYRPISIATSFSKTLEKKLEQTNQVILRGRKILSLLQFGFRRMASAQDAILFFIESRN